QLVELLAYRDELDRTSGHVLDGERRATARVTVELRHHEAVELDALLEGAGHLDCLLPGHRIEDEQDVERLDDVANANELVHQLLVDVKASRRVDDHHVAAVRLRSLQTCARSLHRVLRLDAIDRDLDLLAELLELVDRRRALQIGRDQPRRLAVAAEEKSQLGTGGGLARALEPGE